jgi:trimeric autotransporter adhesin
MRNVLQSLAVTALLLLYAGSAQTQTISTVVGGGTTHLANNVPATSAALYGPTGIAVDSNNNYYFADCNPSSGYGCVIYKVTRTTGVITIIAGTGAAGYTGDGGAATSATFSNQVNGITVATPSGNIYICDSLYSVIRKVTISNHTISTYAGSNPNKSLYYGGYNGDGMAATSTLLHYPSGIATDATNIYIADNANQRVRKVNSSGIVSTIAGNGTQGYTGDGGAATSAELSNPSGVVLDSIGNLYISNQGINGSGSNVREVTVSTGNISTYAGGANDGSWGDGGLATSAALDVPYNLAISSSNNIYIADTFNNKIRVVASGIINTKAGNGSGGFYGDGGPAINAELNRDYGVAIDGSGVIYISDTYNARIRKVQ